MHLFLSVNIRGSRRKYLCRLSCGIGALNPRGKHCITCWIRDRLPRGDTRDSMQPTIRYAKSGDIHAPEREAANREHEAAFVVFRALAEKIRPRSS